jgi:hypothetical protein
MSPNGPYDARESQSSYYPPSEGYHYPGQNPSAYAGAGAGAGAAAAAAARAVGARPDNGEAGYDDRVPLTREIDDFSRGFQDALGRIGEEDEYDPHNSTGTANNGLGDASRQSSGSKPLWQQNRRQSRNLMWM